MWDYNYVLLKDPIFWRGAFWKEQLVKQAASHIPGSDFYLSGDFFGLLSVCSFSLIQLLQPEATTI